MSRQILLIMLAAFLAGFAVLSAGPAQAVNYLTDIKIQKAADSIAVIITTGQPCEYKAFLTTTKPERIVLDLTGVVNAWKVKKFEELPLQSFEAIRTSQFRNEPEAVTRIVLDVGREIDFRNFQNGSDIVIKLPAVEGEADFADWSAKGVVPQAARASVAPAKPPVEEKPAAPPQVAQAPAENQNSKAKKKASGVEIESYPKRELVSYNTSSFRDPFEPLVGGPGGQLGQGLPSLENLTLVGVLVDEDANRALLEDAEGNGYLMLPSDRVKNGYLVSVTEDTAIFQITEYGWTRTVALELDIEEIK